MSDNPIIFVQPHISFQSIVPITDEMAEMFRQKLKEKANGEWKEEILTMARECGFEANDFMPMTIGKLELIRDGKSYFFLDYAPKGPPYNPPGNGQGVG